MGLQFFCLKKMNTLKINVNITEMKRLVCCSIFFKKIGSLLCKEVNRQVAEKVVKNRPSFIFYFDRYLPVLDYPDMPLIHL